MKADIFSCNPASRTADYDCGDGYVCYTAAQSFGNSICVPKCDPDNEAKTCPHGRCTRAGECLTSCLVGAKPNQPGACPSDGVTSCVRTSYSPVESAAGLNGVCLPIAFSCANSDDCLGSPVFNLCTSDTNGENSDPSLLRTGSVCAQGNCSRDNVACEPGSTCIKTIFGSGGDAPDVCTPNCVYKTDPHDMGVFQCTVGFTCMNVAFPQSSERVCLPGFPGWRCAESLGCSVGTCESWAELGAPFDQLKLCTPACHDDSDCRVYDRSLPGMPANPTFFSRFSCVNGFCHSLASLGLTDACIEGTGKCVLDPDATCMPNVGPMMGGSSCVHPCDRDDECAALSEASHVKHSCDHTYHMCQLALPYLTDCTDDSSCVMGLQCLDSPNGKTCTASCDTNADCAAHALMGSNFACLLPPRICIPKIAAGQMTISKDLCLSGQAPAGICQSPSGWSCDADNQCLSGKCDNSHCQ